MLTGKISIGGGKRKPPQLQGNFSVLPSLNVSTTPSPRLQASLAYYGENLYLYGGHNSGVYLSDFHCYDLTTSRWRRLKNGPAGRNGINAHFVNGIMYVYGGRNSGYSSLSQMWAYDPNTDSWEQKSSYSVNSGIYASSVIGEKIYYLHGYSNGNNVRMFASYDTLTDSWETLNLSQISQRRFHYMDAWNNTLISFAGFTSTYTKDLFYYNTSTREWLKTQIISGDRPLNTDQWPLSGVIGDRLYTISSRGNYELRSIDLTKGLESVIWEKDATTSIKVTYHQAFCKSRDRLYFFGGNDGNTNLMEIS